MTLTIKLYDVESVKDDAVRSYGEKSVENTCRITRWSCYALLADLYLWKGDWQKCIDYCDWVIERAKTEKLEYIEIIVAYNNGSIIQCQFKSKAEAVEFLQKIE